MPCSDAMASRPLLKDAMEVQLGEVDLLEAMYASDGIQIDDASRNLINLLRRWCESDDEKPPNIAETAIFLCIELVLHDVVELATVQLGISVPVVCPDDETDEPQKSKVWIRQCSWMGKAEAARLSDEIPSEDTLSAIDFVKEAATQRFSERSKQNTPVAQANTDLSRVWFYFPSISTRAKRDDIVNYAPTYGLTGFLLAGKPGVLCLEGGSRAIDDYMKFIKTESWKDIPSQHKKVSERFREEGSDVARAFQDMQEITHEFEDSRRGARGNRNDMSVFKAWLDDHQVGEAFEKVFV